MSVTVEQFRKNFMEAMLESEKSSYPLWPHIKVKNNNVNNIKKIFVEDSESNLYSIHCVYKKRLWQDGLTDINLNNLENLINKLSARDDIHGWIEYYKDEE